MIDCFVATLFGELQKSSIVSTISYVITICILELHTKDLYDTSIMKMPNHCEYDNLMFYLMTNKLTN